MDFLDLVEVFFAVTDYTQEYLFMDTDLALFAALLIFMGGIIFWVLMIVAFITGACRLVRKGYWAVIDMRRGVVIPHGER